MSGQSAEAVLTYCSYPEPRIYRQERCELLASVRRKLGNGTVSPLAHGPDSAHSTKRGAPPFRRLNPCEALQIRVLSNQFSNIYAGILFESPDDASLDEFSSGKPADRLTSGFRVAQNEISHIPSMRDGAIGCFKQLAERSLEPFRPNTSRPVLPGSFGQQTQQSTFGAMPPLVSAWLRGQ